MEDASGQALRFNRFSGETNQFLRRAAYVCVCVGSASSHLQPASSVCFPLSHPFMFLCMMPGGPAEINRRYFPASSATLSLNRRLLPGASFPGPGLRFSTDCLKKGQPSFSRRRLLCVLLPHPPQCPQEFRQQRRKMSVHREHCNKTLGTFASSASLGLNSCVIIR